MRAHDAGPPEDGFENLVVFLKFDERGSREIEVDVRIPAGDLGGPGVVGIAQVRAQDGQLGKAAGDVVEGGGAHAVDTDVGGNFRVRAHYDAAVEQDKHSVLFSVLVNRPIGFVVVILQGAAEFAQAAESG